MRRVREDNLVPLLSAIPMVRLGKEQSREFALGARCRLEGHGVHVRDPREGPLELVEEPQGSLDGRFVLVGMDPRHCRQSGELLGVLRVELHRAGTEGVEPAVDPEGHLREAGVVAHHVVFGHVRDRKALPTEGRRDEPLQVDGTVLPGPLLEEKGLVVVRLTERHASSSRAARRRAWASTPCRSVVAKRATSASSGKYRFNASPPWIPRARRPLWISS